MKWVTRAVEPRLAALALVAYEFVAVGGWPLYLGRTSLEYAYTRCENPFGNERIDTPYYEGNSLATG